MRCTAPLLDINATNVQIGLEMDNVTALLDLNVTLTLYPNPLFETGFVLEFSAGDTRNITINVIITKNYTVRNDYLLLHCSL